MDPFKTGACQDKSGVEARLTSFPLIEYIVLNLDSHAKYDLDESVEKQVLDFLNDYSLMSATMQFI